MVGDTGFFVVQGTVIIAVNHLETAIIGVLDIKNLIAIGFAFLHIFVVIHENRLNGIHFHTFHLFQEIAFHIAVHHHGSDFRLIHLLDITLLALAFINHHIIIVLERALCKIHNIFLGYHTHVLSLVEHILPALVRNVCKSHLHATVTVAFERGHIAEFPVVDGSG